MNIRPEEERKLVNIGSIYGILKEDKGNCKINNKIYEQLICDHMMMKVIRKDRKSVMSEYNYKSNFIDENGDLDIKKILIKFQDFMKHEYSEKRSTSTGNIFTAVWIK